MANYQGGVTDRSGKKWRKNGKVEIIKNKITLTPPNFNNFMDKWNDCKDESKKERLKVNELMLI